MPDWVGGSIGRSILNLTPVASAFVPSRKTTVFRSLTVLDRVGEAVRRDVRGLRGVAHEPAVGRDVDQATPDVHRDPQHFVAGRGVEVEMGDLVTVGHAECASALGRLSIGERCQRGDDSGQRYGEGERYQRDEETDVEASETHDVFLLAERA